MNVVHLNQKQLAARWRISEATAVSLELVIGSATVNKVAYLMRMQQLMLGYVISKSVACNHFFPSTDLKPRRDD